MNGHSKKNRTQRVSLINSLLRWNYWLKNWVLVKSSLNSSVAQSANAFLLMTLALHLCSWIADLFSKNLRILEDWVNQIHLTTALPTFEGTSMPLRPIFCSAPRPKESGKQACHQEVSLSCVWSAFSLLAAWLLLHQSQLTWARYLSSKGELVQYLILQ